MIFVTTPRVNVGIDVTIVQRNIVHFIVEVVEFAIKAHQVEDPELQS